MVMDDEMTPMIETLPGDDLMVMDDAMTPMIETLPGR
jgi:hypothetical protein